MEASLGGISGALTGVVMPFPVQIAALASIASSVKGSVSYVDRFKAPPTRVDIVSSLSIPSVSVPSIGKGCDISISEVVVVSSVVGADFTSIPNFSVVTSVADFVVLTMLARREVRAHRISIDKLAVKAVEHLVLVDRVAYRSLGGGLGSSHAFSLDMDTSMQFLLGFMP
ncbi:hypothetical protein Q3G72_035401 [Acer saccharum]|nr:hypothetical protein Q3G72_035401 [Acer saccharum]